jgi:O6-methylguanine-DNA--protein-cysteine methyltransferase
MPVCFTLFDTAIGRCGLAWSARGVMGVQLPEADAAKTRDRLLQRFPEALEAKPEAEVKRAEDGIVLLLRGEPSDLSAIPLDMNSVPPFHRRVYDAARKLRYGTTATYGSLAEQIGAQGAARAVGQALAKPVCAHRAMPQGGRVERKDGRLLRRWRRRDKTSPSRNRRCGTAKNTEHTGHLSAQEKFCTAAIAPALPLLALS